MLETQTTHKLKLISDMRMLYRTLHKLKKESGQEKAFLKEYGTEKQFLSGFKVQPYDKVEA